MTGEVFGHVYISGRNHFYPVWRPEAWNTACISASTALGYYRININGHTAWQIEDFKGDLFSNVEVRLYLARLNCVTDRL